MKIAISKNNKIFWPVVILLVLQKFLSSEIFWILGFAIVCYYIFFENNGRIFLPFSECKALIIFLIWGACLGLYSLSRNESTITDYIRDMFYFTNPLIFMTLGAIYCKKKINIYSILNAFIIASGVLSTIQLISILQNLTSLYSVFTVQGWRNIVGDGVIVSAFALAVVFTGIIPNEMKISKWLNSVNLVVTGIVFILSLSRTNMIVTAIIYVCLLLKKGNIKKVLLKVFVTIIVLFGAIVFLNNALPSDISAAYTEKLLSSLKEISSSHSWDSNAEIQANWRGYETYCAIREWESGSVFSQIFGNGFGKRIYVGKYAYTLLKQVDSSGNALQSIAVLHNGYATTLIKLGALGVAFYVIFYLVIIRKSCRVIIKKDSLNARLLLAMGLSFLVLTYFLNGLFKDYCFFPLVIVIGYSAYSIQFGME